MNTINCDSIHLVIPNVDFQQLNLASLPWTLLFIVVTLLMRERIIQLLELSKGYGSLQWILLAIFKSEKIKDKKDPLKIRQVLYEIESIVLVPAE